jgi:16S rRNA (uracil1498-N3)-methyltransferase
MRDRFFVEGVHAVGDRIAFAPDDARKLATVLRKRSGDRVQVVDSGGVAYGATLDVDGRTVAATLDEQLERGDVETALRITIAQAVPKGQKMDLVVEKATELGAHAIVPVRSARVIGHDTSPAKVERWRRIAKSAAQQSGRARVPDVTGVHDWEELLATFASYDRVYVPWELADPAPLREVFERDLAGARSVLVVIGPEGGFAAEEVARAHGAGARAISLGRRILRTETAALVVVAALLYASGEL